MKRLVAPIFGVGLALSAFANCSGGAGTTSTSTSTSSGGSSGTSGTSGGSSGTSGTSGGSSGTSGTSGGSSGTSGASGGLVGTCPGNTTPAAALSFTIGTPQTARACVAGLEQPTYHWKATASVAADETLCVRTTGLSGADKNDVDIAIGYLEMGEVAEICSSALFPGEGAGDEECEGAHTSALSELYFTAINYGPDGSDTGDQDFTFTVTRGACPTSGGSSSIDGASSTGGASSTDGASSTGTASSTDGASSAGNASSAAPASSAASG